MATEAQISANRRNAQNSTGPKTEEGKARSSRNAEKHGLTARWTVIAGEADDEFTGLLASNEDRFDPQGELEADLVRQLAVTQFRLARAARLETSILRDGISDALRHRALAIGVEAALKDAYHRPRPPGITADAKAWVVHLACTNPPLHPRAPACRGSGLSGPGPSG